MALRASAATGNWNATGSWTGGLIPGNGDTALIQAGHTITVTDNRTVGISATGSTSAIQVDAGGHLKIGTGATLTARGWIWLKDAPFTMDPGSTLEFDASASTPTPMNQHYVLMCGDGPYNTNTIVTINGTAGARCTIRSNAGGGNGNLHANSGRRQSFAVSYCDFINLGQSGVAALQCYNGAFDFSQCVFDGCSYIETFYEPATTVNRFDHVTMKNGIDSFYSIFHGATPVALTSGTRVMSHCVFDKTVQHTFRDYTITDTLFSGDPPLAALAAGSYPWAAFSGNLLHGTGITETTPAGPVTDGYYLQSSAGNPHYFQHVFTTTVDGVIFEYLGTSADGDANQPSAAGGPYIVTIKNCLGLPNAANASSGTLFSLLGNANTTLDAYHNTWFGGAQACGVIGETYAGHAGILREFHDNLFWDLAATTYKLVDYSSTVVDVVAAAKCHHNGGYLMLAGSNLKGYHNIDFSSGAPGANDVNDVDPQFVDRTRDIAAWDASIAGGAGSAAHALAELKKKNDASGYNAAYTIAALIAWVKAGFVPQAAEYDAASDSVGPSNGWIGALVGVAAPPAPPAGWTLVANIAAPSTDGEDVTTPAICTFGATLLVAVIGAFLGPGPTGMLCSKGNTWLPRTIYNSSTAAWLRTFYCPNPIVSAAGVTDHTFTTVGGPGNVPSICVTAWSGAKLVAPYDQENGAGNDGAATIQAGSGATPTEANELVIAGAMIRHAQMITGITGTGFTLLHNVGASGLAMRTGLAYAIQTTPTLANPTWTFDAPQYCAANLATFKAEPAAAATGDLGLLGIG